VKDSSWVARYCLRSSIFESMEEFQVLATGVGHDEEGTRKGGWDHIENGLWVKCITTIRVTSGIQWGKAQIRVLEGGRVHENFFC
jgi:hypothetical protein